MEPNYKNAVELIETWLKNGFGPFVVHERDLELQPSYNTIRLQKEIEGHKCEASVSVEFKRDWRSGSDLVITDADGNQWFKMKVEVDIRWSIFSGLESLAFSMGYVHFLNQVATQANLLQSLIKSHGYEEVYYLYQTKAEADKQKEDFQRNKDLGMVHDAIRANCKHQRVLQFRTAGYTGSTQFNQEIKLEGKEYQISTGGGEVHFTRLK